MSMKRPPYMLPVIAAAALLLVSIAAFHRYSPIPGTSLMPKALPAVVLAMDNSYFVGLGRDGGLWSLRAARVELSRDRSTTVLSGISDGHVFSNGKPVLTLKAGRVVYDAVSRNLVLTNGYVINGDGQKVSGSGASWNSSALTLRGTGMVDFESRWGTISAQDLLVDLKNKEWTTRNGHGVIDLKPDEGTGVR